MDINYKDQWLQKNNFQINTYVVKLNNMMQKKENAAIHEILHEENVQSD